VSDVRLLGKIVYELERCPQCGVANPLITLKGEPEKHYTDAWDNTWYFFTGACSKCQRHVLFYGMGGSDPNGVQVTQTYPETESVAEELPEMARKFFQQALESRHAPDGALMLAASAIDAMLKSIGYTDGSLYSRIDKAKDDGAITDSMAAWAHAIRLSANDPRHADEEFTGATTEDAEQSLAFAKALGEYLFVLPSKVARWRARAEGEEETMPA
jgi:hypothetical protein